MRAAFRAFAPLAALSASLAVACELAVSTSGLSDDGPADDSGEPDAGSSAVDVFMVPSSDSSPISSADTGALDSSAIDSSGGETGTPPDTGTADARVVDTGVIDTGVADRGVVDTGVPDTGSPTPDSGTSVCAAGGARVFATSMGFSGNLGGLAGADQSCTIAAVAAGLGGTWNAWLSDASTSANNRIYHVTGGAGYVLLDGTMIAPSFSALVSATTPLLHPIDLTEQRTTITNGFEVWTGTDLGGGTPPGYCAGSSGKSWTSSAHGNTGTPYVGLTNQTNASWSDIYSQFCDYTTERLFCFERCP
jgi:hypothetical protein